jgi:integrase
MKKRKDGRYLKVVTIKGKRLYFYSTADTERKAEKDIQRQILEYTEKEEKGKLFGEVADEWDTEYRNEIPEINYKRNTKARYLKIVEYFGTDYIKDITTIEVNIFINALIDKRYSKKTIAGYKSIINMIFKYAILHGYTRYNPTADIRLPNNLPRNPRKLPSTEELRIVASHYNGFDLLPFFLLFTGCRKSEALAITDKSIDFTKKTITIDHHIVFDGNKPIYESSVKTAAAYRSIILLDRLANVLPHDFKGFLFSRNGDGKEPLSQKIFYKEWKSYCEKYGLNITAHQLRHGYATMLFESEIDVKDAQELMGHSDINLTRQIYTHIRSERKEKTAEKLNGFNF